MCGSPINKELFPMPKGLSWINAILKISTSPPSPLPLYNLSCCPELIFFFYLLHYVLMLTLSSLYLSYLRYSLEHFLSEFPLILSIEAQHCFIFLETFPNHATLSKPLNTINPFPSILCITTRRIISFCFQTFYVCPFFLSMAP